MSEVLYIFSDGIKITKKSMVADYTDPFGHLVEEVLLGPNKELIGLIAKCGRHIGDPTVCCDSDDGWRRFHQQECPICYPDDY